MLDAAGGIGGQTIMMAEQLNHTNAEIVYMDFSSSSMHIAKQRASIRGLSNIVWIQGWIENIPSLDIGKFDLIICSGALHHMKDPTQGQFFLNS